MITTRTIQFVGAVVVLAVALGYLTASIIVKERLSGMTAEATLDIASQLTTVSTLSEVMARGGVDSITESVIKDCVPNERNRFDDLLGRLSGGLSQTELSELSRLFDRCAPFYSRQKAVMTARLQREVELYELLTERLLRVSPQADVAQFSVATWQQLVGYEIEQSTLFERLVLLQGDIIDTLMAGKTVSSPEIATLLKEVSEVVQMQTYNATKINELRASLGTAL
ncbi:hypothetical protein K2Q16_02710 [Patescibacteria group bacterium]|nr:hypothetical protein [Patescibacteria group bacterium]